MPFSHRGLLSLAAGLLLALHGVPALAQDEAEFEDPTPAVEGADMQPLPEAEPQPFEEEEGAPVEAEEPDLLTEEEPETFGVPEEAPEEEMQEGAAPAVTAPPRPAPAQQTTPATPRPQTGGAATGTQRTGGTPGATTRAQAGEGQELDRELVSLWEDFNHYFLIARPDLALASAQALLDRATPAQLLDVAEASREYPQYEETLARAQQVETLRDISRELARQLQMARFERAQDPERIMADIRRLAEGPRAQANAMARLRAAGQYAAPHLLRVLLDERERALHPYVLDAMADLGQPLVYPLSVALPHLEPVPQSQIAQVLAEIGYRLSLPYLRQVGEDPRTDPGVRRVVQTADRQIARTVGVSENVSAAELFFALAQNYYERGTQGNVPGVERQNERGIVWHYGRGVGLVPIPVPAAIFGDVLAMRAAQTALELDPRLDPALSVWLMANLRRENRLPQGQVDPSYAQEMQPPMFYAVAAGPLRQHDVLNRALLDRDSVLALDAIEALDATAGTEALLNRQGTVQPLLRALTFPDRRVRYEAAFALTNARPRSEFPGSNRVVPVLAEAVRQGETRFAVVIGRDQGSLNALVAAARELGYQTYAGTSLAEVMPQVQAGTGADLIVTNQEARAVSDLYRESSVTDRLASVPIVAVVPRQDQIELNRRFDRDPRVTVLLADGDQDSLRAALDEASRAYTGAGIDAPAAERYATTALRLLREIALAQSRVFRVSEAQPALIQALDDERAEIAAQAGQVLAMLPSPEAQRAVADAGLSAARDEALRIEMLDSLAESATQWGNHLSEAHLGQVLELVRTGQGELAIAAARAHGALTLPTSNVVELIGAGRSGR